MLTSLWSRCERVQAAIGGRFIISNGSSQFLPTKSLSKSCVVQTICRIFMQAVRPWVRVADGNPPRILSCLMVL